MDLNSGRVLRHQSSDELWAEPTKPASYSVPPHEFEEAWERLIDQDETIGRAVSKGDHSTINRERHAQRQARTEMYRM